MVGIQADCSLHRAYASAATVTPVDMADALIGVPSATRVCEECYWYADAPGLPTRRDRGVGLDRAGFETGAFAAWDFVSPGAWRRVLDHTESAYDPPLLAPVLASACDVDGWVCE